MSKRKLRALLQCGSNRPHSEFFTSQTNARALVALKRAVYIDNVQTNNVYDTRAMQAAPIQKKVDADQSGESLAQDVAGFVSTQLSTEQNQESESMLENADNENVISNIAREFAESNGIDYTVIKGSGKNGKILKSDIISIMENNNSV